MEWNGVTRQAFRQLLVDHIIPNANTWNLRKWSVAPEAQYAES